MADRDEEEQVVELVTTVLDELDRHTVAQQSAEKLRIDSSTTDSGQHPRLSPVEREKMLRQLSVE
jgi:erythromycin esterase-like protein